MSCLGWRLLNCSYRGCFVQLHNTTRCCGMHCEWKMQCSSLLQCNLYCMLTTDQNKISMPKIYPILGMLLFLFGLITNYIYFTSLDPTKNGELNGPFVEQLKNFPPLLLSSFPLIIAPILEEFAFRG